MRNYYKKPKTAKLLILLLVTAVVSSLTMANDKSDPAQQTKEVLTTLEQRMQKKISVDFRNTPIEDVLRIMADQADIDIVKSPTVTGNVTATLTNVPLEEALNNILAAHGYGYVTGQNMIRIAPLAEITEKSEMLTSRIYRITYANVEDVEKALKKFLSPRGSLSSNPGTSNIIVTDTESKIKAIDTFIEEIDRITPQILVEARIYDITSKDRLDLGIEWQAGRNTTYSGSGVTGITTVGTNPTKDRDPFTTGVFSGTTNEAENTTAALRFGWLNSGVDIDVLLKAEQEKVQAKLLANPRILVLDNEAALIKIISEIPYQEISESSQGGQVGSTQFREVGVELEVVPHLTRDDMVRLQLKPKFSVQAQNVTVGTSGNQFTVPVVDRREADTTLLVKNGQTIVLGGLRKKDVSQQVNKVPLLGDIPLLGNLFRFEGEDTVTSELVVFVTPKIVTEMEMSQDEKNKFEVTKFEGPPLQPTKLDQGKLK
jgi:type IV pilus assembly protein PilQ